MNTPVPQNNAPTIAIKTLLLSSKLWADGKTEIIPRPWEQLFGEEISPEISTVVVRLTELSLPSLNEERAIKLVKKGNALSVERPRIAHTEVVVDLRESGTLFCSQRIWKTFVASAPQSFSPSSILELYEAINERHPCNAVVIRK